MRTWGQVWIALRWVASEFALTVARRVAPKDDAYTMSLLLLALKANERCLQALARRP